MIQYKKYDVLNQEANLPLRSPVAAEKPKK